MTQIFHTYVVWGFFWLPLCVLFHLYGNEGVVIWAVASMWINVKERRKKTRSYWLLLLYYHTSVIPIFPPYRNTTLMFMVIHVIRRAVFIMRTIKPIFKEEWYGWKRSVHLMWLFTLTDLKSINSERGLVKFIILLCDEGRRRVLQQKL